MIPPDSQRRRATQTGAYPWHSAKAGARRCNRNQTAAMAACFMLLCLPYYMGLIWVRLPYTCSSSLYMFIFLIEACCVDLPHARIAWVRRPAIAVGHIVSRTLPGAQCPPGSVREEVPIFMALAMPAASQTTQRRPAARSAFMALRWQGCPAGHFGFRRRACLCGARVTSLTFMAFGWRG